MFLRWSGLTALQRTGGTGNVSLPFIWLSQPIRLFSRHAPSARSCTCNWKALHTAREKRKSSCSGKSIFILECKPIKLLRKGSFHTRSKLNSAQNLRSEIWSHYRNFQAWQLYLSTVTRWITEFEGSAAGGRAKWKLITEHFKSFGTLANLSQNLKRNAESKYWKPKKRMNSMSYVDKLAGLLSCECSGANLEALHCPERSKKCWSFPKADV